MALKTLVGFFFSSLVTLAGSCQEQDHCFYCQNILQGKILEHYQRYPTFLYALNLMHERQSQVIIETGTSRYGKEQCIGDGCSTLIFAEWIERNGGVFYSVDISANAILKASNALDMKKKYVNFVHSDSVQFLTHFNQPIDFLYLDSYDFEVNNPSPSQEHHLKEIMAAYPWLWEESIVMIDDCDLPHGGKGKLAIEFLLDRGWKIVAKGYQVILVKK